MKRILSLLPAIALILGLAACGGAGEQPSLSPSAEPSVQALPSQSPLPEESTPISGEAGKVLVAYFSATNRTEAVAQTIADTLNGDIFEITPVTAYTADDLNYRDENSRVSQEHDDPSRQTVALTVTTPDNWEDYDTVFIGYPIWWQNASWVVTSFVSANDFEGKTVIPFCTSASSALGESDKNLAAAANGGEWLPGQRFRSSVDSSEVVSWVEGLALTTEEDMASAGRNGILIAYFTADENREVDAVSSASVTTVDGTSKGLVRAAADMIAEGTGGELFSIQTVVKYSGNRDEVIDYASDEQSKKARPELANHIEDLDSYDTIFIGYPTWWYDMPMAMYSFFEEYDFSNKTIIPFNVHNGSRFSGTISTIKDLEPNATVIENGFTVSEQRVAQADDDVAKWLQELGY